MERIRTNVCVVGTGAAGYNAAGRLWDYGEKDILLVSEGVNMGTSRNTGSDKQTYYKLTLSGDTPDSVREMAQTLFEGHGVDGDIALCEAALSTTCFLHLAELGIPFPTNRYGEYVGYKTDHDPRTRATSIGPYTSREMTKALQKDVERKGITFLDNLLVVKVLVKDQRVMGLLALDTQKKGEDSLVFIECPSLVWATGGPAGMYASSVYPESQCGASGLAFEAGVKGRNLTEWQFGLASIHPRWNVSGTYMQVLPRLVSTAQDGSDEREFLMDFFSDRHEMLSKLFLKGYQWPFDVRKVEGGSSIIDILVYLETKKGRRVFLDYRKEPCGGEFSFSSLSEEAYAYLEKAEACIPLPIERLRKMNAPAISFYRDKGVDLETEMLEVSLCAQHNNGGLEVDCWWRSNIRGFYPVGEVAGSHGVYRPGGSALNAGQVGSTRAARYIAARGTSSCFSPEEVEETLQKEVGKVKEILEKAQAETSTLEKVKAEVTEMMSLYAGAIRNSAAIASSLGRIDDLLSHFTEEVKYSEERERGDLFRLRSTLLSQKCYMAAMKDYAEKGGKSRGSALYTDKEGRKPYDTLPQEFQFSLDDGSLDDQIQEVELVDGECHVTWRKVRPIPEDDGFFENVWRRYREDGNVW